MPSIKSFFSSIFSPIASVLGTPIHYALHQAIDNGYTRIIWAISFLPIDYNRHYNDWTPLQRAAKNGNPIIIKELLKIKSVRDNAAANSNTALYLASERGDLPMVQELLAIPVVRDNDATHILYEALVNGGRHGCLDVAYELYQIPKIKSEASSNILLRKEMLRVAVIFGHLPLVQKLLATEAIKNIAVQTSEDLVTLAINSGKILVLRELLKIEEIKNNTALDHSLVLREAIKGGNSLMVKELLAMPIIKNNVTANNNTAFLVAAKGARLSIVLELLKIPAVKGATISPASLATISSFCHSSIVYAILKTLWHHGNIPAHIKRMMQPNIRMALNLKVQLALEFKKFKDSTPTYSSELISSSNGARNNIASLSYDLIGRILQFVHPEGCEKLIPMVLMFRHHISHERFCPKLADLAVEAAESVLAIEKNIGIISKVASSNDNSNLYSFNRTGQ